MAKQHSLRNISTTSEEIYETVGGAVRVERAPEFGKSKWKVWPIGARPKIVNSKAEAFARAELIDAERGGIRDVIRANKSAATLDAEIDAFLRKQGH